jgi:hypothetical protein
MLRRCRDIVKYSEAYFNYQNVNVSPSYFGIWASTLKPKAEIYILKLSQKFRSLTACET